jgi:hypothetical protein
MRIRYHLDPMTRPSRMPKKGLRAAAVSYESFEAPVAGAYQCPFQGR